MENKNQAKSELKLSELKTEASFLTNSNLINTDALINLMPEPIRSTCNLFTDLKEKEVFLMGALGVISSVLPNVEGIYDGKTNYPNLYIYILGKYGSGKGNLNFARLLADDINEANINENNEVAALYQKQKAIFQKKLNQFKKSDISTDPPEKPKSPVNRYHIIPVNNSKSGLIELLKNNSGKGLLFETEGDTLSDALKQDYGNYSEILRNNFHAEQISYYRKTESQYITVKKPRAAVVLSSTLDQLRKLIPNIENGLFSRFTYYILNENFEFINVFQNHKAYYKIKIKEFAKKIKKMHDFLNQEDTKVNFSLSNELEETFVKEFRTKKNTIIAEISPDLNGMANRLGTIAFKLMMILTALRYFYENSENRTEIICSEQDYKTAMALIDFLALQSIKVYEMLEKDLSSHKNKELAISLKKAGVPYSKISEITGFHRGSISKF